MSLGLVLFDNPSKVVRDRRVINAILRRAAKENGLPDGVKMVASPWGYIEFDYVSDNAPHVSASYKLFHHVEYKGKMYKSEYFSGCFCPYVVEMS